MARLNKKQRRQKKWNNKFIRQIKIKKEIDNIKKEINEVQESGREISEEEFSNIAKEVGMTITKGLLPKFRFVDNTTKGELKNGVENSTEEEQ